MQAPEPSVSPAFPQTEEESLELVPLPTELRLSGMARVVTDSGRPHECLAPVAIKVKVVDFSTMKFFTQFLLSFIICWFHKFS